MPKQSTNSDLSRSVMIFSILSPPRVSPSFPTVTDAKTDTLYFLATSAAIIISLE